MLQKIALMAFVFTLSVSSLAVANTHVLIKTSMGDVTIALDDEKAPISTKNFVTYVNNAFYNGTIFHRVIPNFMIQGGGFDKNMQEKVTLDPIENEANNGLKNRRGTVAMARTSAVNSATSQFFINVVDNDYLDYSSPSNYGYAVFGKVVKGMGVVDKIAQQPTTRVGVHQNVPREAITILSAQVVTAK